MKTRVQLLVETEIDTDASGEYIAVEGVVEKITGAIADARAEETNPAPLTITGNGYTRWWTGDRPETGRNEETEETPYLGLPLEYAALVDDPASDGFGQIIQCTLCSATLWEIDPQETVDQFARAASRHAPHCPQMRQVLGMTAERFEPEETYPAHHVESLARDSMDDILRAALRVNGTGETYEIPDAVRAALELMARTITAKLAGEPDGLNILNPDGSPTSDLLRRLA